MAISTIDSTGLSAGGVAQSNLGTGVAGSGPAFMLGSSGLVQAPTYATLVVVQLNSSVYDSNSVLSISTYRATPNVAGYYLVQGSIGASGFTTGNQYVPAIMKNGSTFINGAYTACVTGLNVIQSVSGLVYCNGTTDYLQLGIFDGQNGGTKSIISGSSVTFLSGALVRAA